MTDCKYLLRRGMSVLCIDSTDPSRNDCDHCIDIKCFDNSHLASTPDGCAFRAAKLEAMYDNGYADGADTIRNATLDEERKRIIKWLEDNWQFFEIEDADDSQRAQIEGYDILVESLRGVP